MCDAALAGQPILPFKQTCREYNNFKYLLLNWYIA